MTTINPPPLNPDSKDFNRRLVEVIRLMWVKMMGADGSATGYPISEGGTGADNAVDARANLGLSTKSEFDTALTDGNFAFSGGDFHNGFSDFDPNEHIDWTSTSSNLNTSGSVTSGALTANGNVTLGDASGDTLTINAGTWTIGGNYTATRAVGVAASGASIFLNTDITLSGDSGGTTNAVGSSTNITFSGSYGSSGVSASRAYATHSGSVSISDLRALSFRSESSGSGGSSILTGVNGTLVLSGSGNVTSGGCFIANAPGITSTGKFTNLFGFTCGNMGHATLVDNAIAFNATNMTIAAAQTASFKSTQNSGAGAWGFFHSGTANNAFNGATILGATSAPVLSGSGKLDMVADLFRLRTAKTPSSAGDTGNQGEYCWDSSYLYICTATNTWSRIAHATW